MFDFTTNKNRFIEGSKKWRIAYEENHENCLYVPFTAADMEFIPPSQLKKGLTKVSQEMIFGYTIPTDKYYTSIIDWMKRRHNFTIVESEILTCPGVNNSILECVKAFSKVDDGVIVFSPVYNMFQKVILEAKRNVVVSNLIFENSEYHINFKELENFLKQDENKILILCSPHNPIGKVWTKEDLQKILYLCNQNEVILVCDEIHHDLIMPEYKFYSLMELSSENDLVVVCTAPTKSFNLAGLLIANILIKNNSLRHRLKTQLELDHQFKINIFGLKACEIVYNECELWLENVIEVIQFNQKYIEERLKPYGIKFSPFEATYLTWLDFSDVSMKKNIIDKLLHDANLLLVNGEVYGGKQYQLFYRWNVACPTHEIINAVDRLVKEIERM